MISDPDVLGLLYLVSIVCFVLALRFLSSPKHARRGNWLGGVGMLVAIATTLAVDGISNWALIVVAAAIGSVVGLVGARRVKMTAMPQMVALFNGVGGGAAALVALAEFHELDGVLAWDEGLSIALSALIGSISFAGSLVAFAKLQELVSGRPIVFPGQNVVNVARPRRRGRARGRDRRRARGAVGDRRGSSSWRSSSASCSCSRSAARTCRS